MVSGVILMVASMAGLVAGIVGVKLLLHPASALRVGIFRPWRGDAWPQGVQEADQVRFDWAARGRRRMPVSPNWDDIVVEPTTTDTPVDPDPSDIAVEDLPGEAVTVEHLASVSVHRPH